MSHSVVFVSSLWFGGLRVVVAGRFAMVDITCDTRLSIEIEHLGSLTTDFRN